MKRNVKQNNRSVGAVYEQAAGYYLEQNGYELIEYNYRCRDGEIDIIARRRKLIIFAEVKKRRTIEKAAYAISARQKERIRRGAETFIARHPQYAGFQFRFDAVLIRFPFPSGIWKTSGKSEIGFSGEKLQPERYKQKYSKKV